MLTRISSAPFFGASLLLGLVGSLAAQQPAQTEGQNQVTPRSAQVQLITLDQAIELALERNPTVQQAENSTRLSELTVQQQQRQLLPSLRLSAGSGVPYAYGGANAPDPNLTAGIAANIQIGNIYTTVANMQQARLNQSGSQENLTRSRQTVVFNVLNQYISYIEAREAVSVQEKNLATVQAQQEQIQAYVTQGRRPVSDMYQQQASTASAQLSLLQSQRSSIVAQMNLIRTLQLDPFGEYDFVTPDLGQPRSASSFDLAAITQQALAERPDLRSSQISLKSAEQGLRIASASRWPSLSLQFGYNTGNFNSLSAGGVLDQLDRGRRGNLSLNVSVPILDFAYPITKERAKIQLENARISLENARQGVAIEVRTAYLDLQLAEQQLSVAEAQLQAADLAYQMAQQRYGVQLATLLEVTQAQVTQLRSAINVVNARYGLIFQSRVMDYYLGILQTD